MIYFDNAATTFHKPESVYKAVNKAIKELSANPGRSGHNLSLKAAETVYETRVKVANFFGAKSYENVVFTQNCTMSINMCMRGLLNRGEHFIISDLEHNSVLRTAVDIKRQGIEFDIFEFDYNVEKTLNNIKSLIKQNTKAIICTNGSNVFGIKLHIKEIGNLCKNNRIKFIVDAAQTAGVIDINMNSDNIDYLCIAPHKGLYSPMGLGILITDNLPLPYVTGGTGSSSALSEQPEYLPDKYESGTINVPAIAGLNAGIEFVEKNKNYIYQKEMNIINYIYNELSKMRNITLYNKPDLPVLSFNVDGFTADEVGNYLNENQVYVRTGLHCAPLAHKKFKTQGRGTVRVSVSYFNTMNEANEFINLIKKFWVFNRVLFVYSVKNFTKNTP